MSKLWFTLLWFSVITIAAGQEASGGGNSQLGKTLKTYGETMYNYVSPILLFPIKKVLSLSWSTSVGTILLPLTAPVKYSSELVNGADKAVKEIDNNISNATSEATAEMSGKKSPTDQQSSKGPSTTLSPGSPTSSITSSQSSMLRKKRRRRRSLENQSTTEKSLSLIDELKGNSTFKQYISMIFNSENTKLAAEEVALALKELGPTLDYIRDNLLPNLLEHLQTLEKSGKLSESTVDKIENVKQVYKILSFMGYLPPANFE